MLLGAVLYFPLTFLAFTHVNDEYGHTDASATENQGRTKQCIECIHDFYPYINYAYPLYHMKYTQFN